MQKTISLEEPTSHAARTPYTRAIFETECLPGLGPLLHTVPFPDAHDTLFDHFVGAGGQTVLIALHRFDHASGEARMVFRGAPGAPDMPEMLGRAEALAKRLGAYRLVTQEKIAIPEAAHADAFVDHGFQALDESWTFECPFEALAERAERVHALLVRRKKVPASLQITALADGLATVRARLESAGLMDGFDFDARISGRTAYPILVEHSRLLWQGNELVGLLLATATEQADIYQVPVRWVAAGARQTWVNACLMQIAVAIGRANGARFIRFNANPENHGETLRLAAHADGQRIARVRRYGKQLGTDA